MSEQRTGAQIMCEALIREGVDMMFGIPGGAIMPFYHALPEYPTAAPRAVPPRAGRRPRRRGLRARHRQGRRVRRHQRPRRDEPGHADRRRAGWTARRWSRSPARCRARCSARTPSRRPTSPASRCRSPSTTTWCATRRGYRRTSFKEAFHIAAHRPARPGADRHHQGRAAGARRPELGRHARPARLQADRRAAIATQIREAAELIAQRQAAADPGRQRRHRCPAPTAELRALAERTRHPGRSPRCTASARFPRTIRWRSACRACTAGCTSTARSSECDVLINIGRRFDDRVTGKASTLRAERQDHPRRHRPGRDRQERQGRTSPIVGDAKQVLQALLEELPARRQLADETACQRLDRSTSASCRPSISRKQQYRPRPDTRAACRTTCTRRSTASSTSAATTASSPTSASTRCGRRSCIDWHQPRTHITSGGAGTMGFARAGGDGRGDRLPGRDGLGDRRRRRLPDDESRSWRRCVQEGMPKSRSRSSTTATWAWCASGRSCSTRSATAARR